MGLFGKLKIKVDPDRLMAGMTGAQATLAGDYAGAAAAWGHYRKRKDERKRAEQEAEAAEMAYRALRGVGVPDEAARVMALDPEARARFLGSEHETKKGGYGDEFLRRNAEGGMDRIYGVRHAPGDLEKDRAILDEMDPSGGLSQSRAAKEALIINRRIDPNTGAELTEAMDPRTLYNFGSPSAPGMARDGSEFEPGAYERQPERPKILTPEEMDRLTQGGAGRVAPRPFRRGLFGR